MNTEIMVVSLTDGTNVEAVVHKTERGDFHALLMMGFMEPQIVVKRESAIELCKRILTLLEAD